MNGRVHFGCLLFMIIFSAHRKQIRDFVTYATSVLFIALHFGFAGIIFAQSNDNGAPVITSQPRSRCFTPFVPNFYFDVSATGRLPLRYQWYKGDVPILNATNLYFYGPGGGPEGDGLFSVVVSNELGFARSAEAGNYPATTFQVNIVLGLKDQTVYEGDRIDLSVFVCDGGGTSGASYWWKKNGVLVSSGFNEYISNISNASSKNINIILSNLYIIIIIIIII